MEQTLSIIASILGIIAAIVGIYAASIAIGRRSGSPKTPQQPIASASHPKPINHHPTALPIPPRGTPQNPRSPQTVLLPHPLVIRVQTHWAIFVAVFGLMAFGLAVLVGQHASNCNPNSAVLGGQFCAFQAKYNLSEQHAADISMGHLEVDTDPASHVTKITLLASDITIDDCSVFLPSDAVLQGNDNDLNRYSSASLATELPAQDFPGVPTGSFYVLLQYSYSALSNECIVSVAGPYP